MNLNEVQDVFCDVMMTPHQSTFAYTQAEMPLALGGQGSGKSFAGICRAILLSINSGVFGDCSGNRGLIGRQSRQELISTTMAEFLSIVPRDWIQKEPRKPDYECVLVNGSIIQFVPMEDLGRFKSHNLGWAFLEEMDEIKEEVWEEIAINRLRRLMNIPKTQYIPFHTCFGVCNPTQNWVFDIWGANEEKLLSKDKEEKASFDPNFLVIHSSTYENEENLAEGFIARREKHFGMNTDRAKMYLLGQWGGIRESIYPFSYDMVNDEDYWPPVEQKTIVTLDHAWGVSGEIALDFLALEEDEIGRTKVLIYDEITLKGQGIAEAVEALDERLQYHALKRPSVLGKTSPERLPIYLLVHDPSMRTGVQRTKKEDQQQSITDTYIQRAAERGLALPMLGGNNNVLVGIDRVIWLMTHGLLRWNPRCVDSIKQHKNYVWDGDKKDTPLKKKDHHPDGVRYGCMALNLKHHFPDESHKPTMMDKIRKRKNRFRKRELVSIGRG